jgi:ATP-dependent DNA helicase UvrD/PcrA
MSHWTDVRRSARSYASQLREHTGGDASAKAVLAAASAVTGIKCVALAADDPLLDGGDAVYDPEVRRVWYSRDTEPELAFVYQAHEFAHHWLGHTDRVRCDRADVDPEAPEEPVPVGVHRVQGYGPKERRERDANVFAREFLLPTNLLRQWFIEEGLSAPAIAVRVGVPPGMVFHQLAYSVLVGDLPRVEHYRPSYSGRAPKAASTDRTEPALDPSQREAAHAEHGPVLVEAGPGTGKTRTLVGRVLHLLDQGVDPASILALTFSNKAAEEMRERIAQAAPESAALIWMGTFHAFGLDLLRRYGTHLGLSTDPPVLDPVDAMFLLERELPALQLSYYQYLPEPTRSLKPILSAISRAKDELATPAAYAEFARRMRTAAVTDDDIDAAEKAIEVAHAYAVYQSLLERDGLLDFGDLIARTVALLGDEANGVRAAVRGAFRHVLVDEYQDVNRASAILLKQIADDGHGLWVVGDARQSIYRFRGAAPVNMQLFAQDFPGGRVVPLTRNYRSQPPVVRAVSAFAAAMPALPGESFTRWEADRPATDGTVRMEIAEHGRAEGEGIVRAIEQYRRDRGLNYRDQAILCRSHAYLARVARQLEDAGIPVLYLGDLFERTEVRDLLALLSLACHGDGRGLVRVARFSEYCIPLTDVRALLALSKDRAVRFPGALGLARDTDDITSEGRERIALLERHVDELCYGTNAWVMLSRYLFERSEYVRRLAGDTSAAGRQQRLAIYQFLQFVYEQRRSSHEARRLGRDRDPKRSLLRFVRRLAMESEDTQLRQVPDWASDVDAVRLLTVHASKGLEFPIVYVPLLAHTKFPANRQWNPCPPPLEMVGAERDEKAEHAREEECLLFVAISRARDVLCLSRALRYGKVKNKASPLLDRLDVVLPRPSGSTTVTWPAPTAGDDDDAAPEATPVPSPLPVHTERALEKYLTCPRRYYYEEVLQLTGAGEDTAYLKMHTSVYRVLRWIAEETGQGRAVASVDASARLADAWRAGGPRDHPYAALYWAAAEDLVARALQHAARRRGRSSQPDWTLTLPHGRVTLTPDHVELIEEDGTTTVVVQRMRTGRPSSGEAAKRIYALYQTAAAAEYPGGTPRVEIAYLATDVIETVSARPRTIETRVAEYDEAMAGILRGDFRPSPDEYRCPRCAHYFICPHAEDA